MCLRQRSRQTPRTLFRVDLKAKGTTVNVRLTSKTAKIYQAATQQYKTVKSLLNRLERLSRFALATRAKQAESDAKQ